jgi:hypothetical protein
MSYDIIYNRQFIKVDENRVIPFLEMGSNNCYEASGNGRKRARSWGNSFGFTNGKLIANNEDILKEIDNFEESTKQNCIENSERYGEGWEYDPKRFGYHTGISFYGKSTRSTSFDAFKSYYKNGIKEAMTIEELWENDIRITLHVYRWLDEHITSKGLEIKPDVTFTSTQHMIDTINEYETYYGNKTTLYLHCNGDWLIERMKKRNNRNKVANRKEKKRVEVNEYFVLRNDNGGYFVRNTARGYKYTFFASGSSVKSFMSEKQAESFKNKMRNGDLFVIEKREGSCVFSV